MGNYNLKNIYAWPITTRILLIGLVCSIVFYLGNSWDIASIRLELSKSQQQETNLKQQIELIITKQHMVKNEISSYEMLRSLLVAWQKRLVNHHNIPELLNDILKAGGNHQLQFSVFNPGKEIKSNGYAKLPIKIIVTGNYHNLASFMSQIANMSTIVVVDNFIISIENKSDVLGEKLAAEANAQDLLTAELTLLIYYLPEKN